MVTDICIFSLSVLEVEKCVNIPRGPSPPSPPTTKAHQESRKCLQHDSQRAGHSKRESIGLNHSQFQGAYKVMDLVESVNACWEFYVEGVYELLYFLPIYFLENEVC